MHVHLGAGKPGREGLKLDSGALKGLGAWPAPSSYAVLLFISHMRSAPSPPENIMPSSLFIRPSFPGPLRPSHRCAFSRIHSGSLCPRGTHNPHDLSSPVWAPPR